MRTVVFFLFFTLMAFFSNAQNNPGSAPDQAVGNIEVTMAELQLKPLRLPSLQDVGGSPFLHAEYKMGIVRFNGDRTVTNVPVKFNIFNNAIMVQRDGDELKLESFDLVSYDEPAGDGSIKHFIFRQGYPETENRPSSAVYQVLSSGPKLHLLKFLSQKVEDAATLGDYSRREIVTTQQLYVYVSGGEIKKIKTGKGAIVDAFPAMAAMAEEITKSKGLNLKNENDLVLLVDELNK
ncbi:MAG TPA: hypothetical protein VN451_09310 [Chitinophagaceae bacterium]|nr:hypothetical protein [Chitinophagaceae bacterium]